MHVQTYGEAMDVTTMIPHILETFLAWNRGLRRKKVRAGRLQCCGSKTSVMSFLESMPMQ